MTQCYKYMYILRVTACLFYTWMHPDIIIGENQQYYELCHFHYNITIYSTNDFRSSEQNKHKYVSETCILILILRGIVLEKMCACNISAFRLPGFLMI